MYHAGIPFFAFINTANEKLYLYYKKVWVKNFNEK